MCLGFAVRVDPTEEGDYRICFDNSFSRFSEKMVYVEVIVDGPEEEADYDENWAALAEPEDSLEYKLEDIRVYRSHIPSYICLYPVYNSYCRKYIWITCMINIKPNQYWNQANTAVLWKHFLSYNMIPFSSYMLFIRWQMLCFCSKQTIHYIATLRLLNPVKLDVWNNSQQNHIFFFKYNNLKMVSVII